MESSFFNLQYFVHINLLAFYYKEELSLLPYLFVNLFMSVWIHRFLFTELSLLLFIFIFMFSWIWRGRAACGLGALPQAPPCRFSFIEVRRVRDKLTPLMGTRASLCGQIWSRAWGCWVSWIPFPYFWVGTGLYCGFLWHPWPLTVALLTHWEGGST